MKSGRKKQWEDYQNVNFKILKAEYAKMYRITEGLGMTIQQYLREAIVRDMRYQEGILNAIQSNDRHDEDDEKWLESITKD